MIHFYGFILGIAIVVGIYLVEFQAKKQKIELVGFNNLIWVVLIGGILGARVHHVITDYHLYQNSWLGIFKIWQGGLSIIGAVMGGVIAIGGWLRVVKRGGKLNLSTILDLSVFGLPVAQAIGRWGNFVNQELYGLPTNLPWGTYIQLSNRLPGFEIYSHFHPLFFYEMFLMLSFAGVVWFGQNFKLFSGFTIGSGRWFVFYVFYYSFIRFWLDFIRIDKIHFLSTVFSENQVLLLIVMIIICSYWIMKKQ